MRSATMFNIALVASSAAPAFAVPIAINNETREPKFTLGGAGKDLGLGALAGGAVAGLTSLANSLKSRAATAQDMEALEKLINGLSARDLDERGVGSSLAKLVGNNLPIGQVIKNALVGGAASGAAIGATESVVQRSVVPDEMEKASELKLPSDLPPPFSQDDNKTHVEIASKVEAREPLGAIGKGLLGTGVGLGASTAVTGVIDQIKNAFARDVTEDEAQQLISALAQRDLQDSWTPRDFEKRALSGVIRTGLLGGVGSALAGTAVGKLLGAREELNPSEVQQLEALFARELESLNDLD